MPARLNHVTIALSHGNVVIPWDSREQLIDQIHPLPRAARVVYAFRGAGTSSPVRLDLDGKKLLLDVIQRWIHTGTLAGLPDGLYDLRNELRSDLRAAE